MTDYSMWRYNEFQQVGTDYDDPAEVEAYDARHAQFRDIEQECKTILDALRVTAESVIIDFGAGTGNFAIHAARQCSKVYAVDVSKIMLDYASKKAKKADVANIVFCHAGFLTYEHEGEPVDTIVTSMAFHHLPDFWKSVALERVSRMLKKGGLLYIHDVIYEDKNATANIARWIDDLAEIGGEKFRNEAAAHIREEHSTLDWIMDGLLLRAGFNIKSRQFQDGVVGSYLCVK